VYKVKTYEKSEGNCDALVEILEGPEHLVLYHFEPADRTATRLGGVFCRTPSLCRRLAEQAAEPSIGYSFISGDEASVWRGWAILETGSLENKCAATVQSHTLSPSGNDTIQIDTKTVEVFFRPDSEEGDLATCSNKQAIAVASVEERCKERMLLVATREVDP
jgi:hypothetical protein